MSPPAKAVAGALICPTATLSHTREKTTYTHIPNICDSTYSTYSWCCWQSLVGCMFYTCMYNMLRYAHKGVFGALYYKYRYTHSLVVQYSQFIWVAAQICARARSTKMCNIIILKPHILQFIPPGQACCTMLYILCTYICWIHWISIAPASCEHRDHRTKPSPNTHAVWWGVYIQ